MSALGGKLEPMFAPLTIWSGELAHSAGRARALVIDALGSTRTARGSLAAGDLRAVALELAAGHLDDALRELSVALSQEETSG